MKFNIKIFLLFITLFSFVYAFRKPLVIDNTIYNPGCLYNSQKSEYICQILVSRPFPAYRNIQIHPHPQDTSYDLVGDKVFLHYSANRKKGEYITYPGYVLISDNIDQNTIQAKPVEYLQVKINNIIHQDDLGAFILVCGFSSLFIYIGYLRSIKRNIKWLIGFIMFYFLSVFPSTLIFVSFFSFILSGLIGDHENIWLVKSLIFISFPLLFCNIFQKLPYDQYLIVIFVLELSAYIYDFHYKKTLNFREIFSRIKFNMLSLAKYLRNKLSRPAKIFTILVSSLMVLMELRSIYREYFLYKEFFPKNYVLITLLNSVALLILISVLTYLAKIIFTKFKINIFFQILFVSILIFYSTNIYLSKTSGFTQEAKIFSISPETTHEAWTDIVITGKNFRDLPFKGKVYIDDKDQSINIIAWTDTKIIFRTDPFLTKTGLVWVEPLDRGPSNKIYIFYNFK